MLPRLRVCVCLFAISELDYLIHLTLHSDNSCRLASGGHNAAAATSTATATRRFLARCWLAMTRIQRALADYQWRRIVNRISSG